MYARQVDVIPIDEAYEHLAKSIVIQAIEDYRKALHKDPKKLIPIEKFFLSDWCYILSGWDGEYLIELLKEQEGVTNGIH